MNEKPFTYNKEMNCIEENGKFLAYLNINNVYCIINKLNEQTETIKELTCNTTRDNIEIEHINNIYEELGFDGVIEYAKEKLNEFGAVREVEDGLWLMATGGWSDHEHWLSCLNDMMCVMNWKGHYIASTRGGGFYYTREPYADIKVVLE